MDAQVDKVVLSLERDNLSARAAHVRVELWSRRRPPTSISTCPRSTECAGIPKGGVCHRAAKRRTSKLFHSLYRLVSRGWVPTSIRTQMLGERMGPNALKNQRCELIFLALRVGEGGGGRVGAAKRSVGERGAR